MPKQARVIVPGFPHHIVQRGYNRQPVFVERRDLSTTWRIFRNGSRSMSWTTEK